MKDPIKIIHKFKNNNKRIQYKVYIFIGDIMPEEIISCIELIKNKDFYDSLMLLSTKRYNLLKDYYGERWYEKFFISYHIKAQKKIIEKTPIKKQPVNFDPIPIQNDIKPIQNDIKPIQNEPIPIQNNLI